MAFLLFSSRGFFGSAANAKVIDIFCALPFLHRPFSLIFQDFVAVNLTVIPWQNYHQDACAW